MLFRRPVINIAINHFGTSSLRHYCKFVHTTQYNKHRIQDVTSVQISLQHGAAVLAGVFCLIKRGVRTL